MEDEERLTPPPADKTKERSGDYLWRVLKPGGCILVLILFVLFMIFCFTYRHDPAPAQQTDPPQQTQQVK